MCPQNVAYMARLTNYNSTAEGIKKSKIGGAVEQSPAINIYYFDLWRDNGIAERWMLYALTVEKNKMPFHKWWGWRGFRDIELKNSSSNHLR